MMDLIRRVLRSFLRSAQPLDMGIDHRLLTEHNRDVVMLVGLDLRVRYVSPSITPMLGWTQDEVLNAQESLIFEADLPLIQAATEKLASGEDGGEATVVRIKAKDGTLRWMESRSRRLDSDDPHRAGQVVVSMRDITDRKQLEDRLSAMALTDGLTGLANRRAFDEALNREWGRTMREHSALSLMLVDLDHFKLLNDRYGHQVGDDCLRTVAAVVRNAARRPADVAARYGGEELALILPDTRMDGAAMIAEEVRQAVYDLAIPHADNGEGDKRVTASIGVATALSHLGGTIKMPEGLLLTADNELYKAKQGGRNRVSATMLLIPSSGS